MNTSKARGHPGFSICRFHLLMKHYDNCFAQCNSNTTHIDSKNLSKNKNGHVFFQSVRESLSGLRAYPPILLHRLFAYLRYTFPHRRNLSSSSIDAKPAASTAKYLFSLPDRANERRTTFFDGCATLRNTMLVNCEQGPVDRAINDRAWTSRRYKVSSDGRGTAR